VTVPRGSERVSQRTRSDMETVDNLTTLPDLDEPNMLHSLNARYLQNKIYTRTGPILVAMNPWQELKLYGSEVLHSYRRKPMDAVPPHVFAIAEAAFANLQAARKDQPILVSGDSGSGKTESTKFMMQYLAAVAHHTAVTANTEQQVLQCNPVLEAFGNAKTLRNDNSSRFGKYIDIHFDERFALCGAKIDTYLLEKSRVVGQEEGERNFHIFYQMCSQAPQDVHISGDLGLHESSHFAYTRKGHTVAVNYKPANSFANTRQAMQGIGIHLDECAEIFKVLAAILHLGNIAVQADRENNAVIHSADTSAVWVSRLLGVDNDALIRSFTERGIQAGPQGGGESFVVAQSSAQALEARNALARALYGNMFDNLVARINVSLGQKRADKTRTISILDIFGFEHFKTNHFEQFCINYANEKLQGHFNEYNFSLEIKECRTPLSTPSLSPPLLFLPSRALFLPLLSVPLYTLPLALARSLLCRSRATAGAWRAACRRNRACLRGG
jgi:myosin-5